MPKRSNKFQKLIHLIQNMLAEDTSVVESAMLTDSQTGAQVEVDVLVFADIGGTKISIGLECRYRKRPATVEWIREMKGKHEHLPVNKTVLVSSSGFSSEARKKAAAWEIDTLTIDEAENTEWNKYIESLSNLKFAGFTVSLLETKIVLKDLSTVDISKFNQDSVLFERDTEYQGTVNEYANHLIRDNRTIKVTTDKWLQEKDRLKEYEPTLNWAPQRDVLLVDTDGREHVIESVHCKVKISVREVPMAMKPGRFRDTNIATGEIEDVFKNDPNRKFLIVTKEENGEIGSGVILTPEGEVRKMTKNESK